MPKYIPVSKIAELGKSLGLEQAILVAWDGELTHVVTWGVDQEACAQAAIGGNKIKKEVLNWPEKHCHTESPIVKTLKKKIQELEDQLRKKQ